MNETAVCIVNETGAICREVKVVSHPDDLTAVLKDRAWDFDRIGLEARAALIAVAVRGACQSRLAVDLHRDPAHEGIPESAAEQIRSHRCPRVAQMMRVNLFRPGACEDNDKPEAPGAADGAQAAARKSDRH